MMKPKVIAILQARMGSTRLPGKVLKSVQGKELLSYEIERLKDCRSLDGIVVATTTLGIDDSIVSLCERLHIPVYRGSSEDVLDRYYRASLEYPADIIVRVTGDCPLIDPDVVDKVVWDFMGNYPLYDYASNTRRRTYPQGLDVEVFSAQSLIEAANLAVSPYDREHVTPYLYTNPEKFYVLNVASDKDYSKYRWTVDTLEDFLVVERIITALYPSNPKFRMEDILKLVRP